MTTNWHTAISVGAAANAATFNTPLGALDEAITNAQTGVYNVLEYGADNTGASDASTDIQSAIDAAEAVGGGVVVIPVGSYKIDTGLTVTAAVHLDLQSGVTLTGPASGYIITLSGEGARVTGTRKGTYLDVQAGGAGGINVVDVHNVSISGLTIDLNTVASAIGIYHLGGWYIHVSDIFIDDAVIGSGGYGVKIESTDAGDGSQGAYVGLYENIIVPNIYANGTDTKEVTTMTFINIDVMNVILDDCLQMTFLQPVVQSTGVGNALFDITDVDGFTCIGGDFEGSGTIYKFSGTCNSVFCYGNETGTSFSGTYKSGSISDTYYFMDFAADSHIIGGITSSGPFNFESNVRISKSLPLLRLQNTGYTNVNHIGVHYDGDVLQLGNNVQAASATTGTLTDVSKGGGCLTIGASTFKMQYADAGANPRTFNQLGYWEYDGATLMPGGKKWSAGNAAPGSGTWATGDVRWNTEPSSGEFIGWVCTAGGTPGTWLGFGTGAVIDQSSTTGAVPVLTVDQADVSEEFIRFIGTSTTDASQSLVDAADMEDPGAIVGWLKIYVQDDQATNPITDGAYYIPFYSAPTHSA